MKRLKTGNRIPDRLLDRSGKILFCWKTFYRTCLLFFNPFMPSCPYWGIEKSLSRETCLYLELRKKTCSAACFLNTGCRAQTLTVPILTRISGSFGFIRAAWWSSSSPFFSFFCCMNLSAFESSAVTSGDDSVVWIFDGMRVGLLMIFWG